MILNNVYRVGDEKAGNISISEGRITDGTANRADDLQLVFNNAIAFPGLINSHDHLDFNLFPQLGDRTHNNYTEWGNYIHQKYKREITAVLNIPIALRTQWGLYKNLLCGVTTVVNHGDKLSINNSPITVIDNCQSLHSVHFEKKWKRRLNNPLKRNTTVVIHTGEGTDTAAGEEIDQLLHWNLLNRKLIGIHGVAMTPNQAKHFNALVWCPQSNYFLLGTTAPIHRLKENVPILFGTDSTLTGHWSIWEHIRQARKTGYLTDNELYLNLTHNPATAWEINGGSVAPGHDADVVVARVKDEGSNMDGLLSLNPADILLVVDKGKIRLFDETLYSQLSNMPKDNFSKIKIDGAYKYVYGDLPGLMKSIQQFYPDAQFPVTCACKT
ncbi:MAG: amidohydrolase family protein [Bacteroidota bacterium]